MILAAVELKQAPQQLLSSQVYLGFGTQQLSSTHLLQTLLFSSQNYETTDTGSRQEQNIMYKEHCLCLSIAIAKHLFYSLRAAF